MNYTDFLKSKRSYAPDAGFAIDPSDVLPQAKPFQRDAILYSLRRGRSALFEECGLGKTLQQLDWAYHVARRTHGPVLILCPLAVAGQTLREAERFSITRGQMPIGVFASGDQVPFTNGIAITNYEKLPKFDPKRFAGVVLDESSILKSYNGKTKRALCDAFKSTPFRLACTATPSPNDLMELGNHSEFLGAMPSSEMLARWFINDSMKSGAYRLRGHAVDDYWRWVAGWAVSLSTPADLGYDDDGYTLPELRIHEHEVDVPDETRHGQLFDNSGISATTIHKEKRRSVAARSEVVASLVNDNSNTWVVWCDTDYEADELAARIPDAVEVRGSMTDFRKEKNIELFSTGVARIIVTKPEICGFGLNWQHCHNTAFVGVSYSFERFYQAIRRLWRFGQLFPVQCHVVNSTAEQVIWRRLRAKELAHDSMKSSMAAAMRNVQMELVRGVRRLQEYRPETKMEVPTWLTSKA